MAHSILELLDHVTDRAVAIAWVPIGLLAGVAEANRRLSAYRRLDHLSDHALADRGLAREDMARRVLGDLTRFN